ncbi:hypothetical protein JRO89_XS09G0223400 [Xanthoceras sorbifolium]|uniref:Uncharacterized protein n=1 Tax=Xanthoceras sorbifolium TaxID=99658 RepID=A0ABQ8HMF0_9ROSI|nr:hypothetical protein JRO89_XS09G0223400 [Xanthoceras sorbifolium]
MNALKKERDPESQKDLEESVNINTEALETTTSDAVLNVPTYDSSPVTPQLAYPLDKIILKGEWDFLQDIYQHLEMGTEVTTNAYPSFVCNRIQKLRDIEDEVERKTLSCIFSYITHLVKFKDQNSKMVLPQLRTIESPAYSIDGFTRRRFTFSFSSLLCFVRRNIERRRNTDALRIRKEKQLFDFHWNTSDPSVYLQLSSHEKLKKWKHFLPVMRILPLARF